jgi:hypothetical protein
MLYDAADEPAALTPEALREAYEKQLRAALDGVDVETAAAESGVGADAIASIVEDGTDDETAASVAAGLTVTDAAAILALDDDHPDAETIVLELRDHLLLAMTTGVVDVDAIASNVDLDLSGQEIQQVIEGRTSMTLDQLAAIQHYLAERNDRR